MELHQPEQPTLQHGRLRRGRKYGRYDFERFDHLSSAHASIGHGTFDKVNVNCRFLFKKSRWGVLGEHKNPAGIIYLDLTFDQPKDSQLHSATVIVTLDDQDKGLQDIPLNRRPSQLHEIPVQITDCYGPKGFAGPETIVQMKKSLSLSPNAQILGYDFDEVGVDKESSFSYSSRWKFSGHLLPGKGNHWAYKTLKWDLSENDLQPQSSHSNEVHTAFTFEHGGQPFFMRIEIKGKLRKLHGRVKDRLMKFPSSSKQEDGSVVTLINFGERVSFKTPLDERAQALEFEMEMANLHAIPMEVPDPKPVTFQPAPQNYTLPNLPSTTASSGLWSQQQSAASAPSLPQQVPSPIQSSPLQEGGNAMTIEDATDPSLVNLAQAFVHLHTMDRQGPHHHDGIQSLANTFSRRGTGNLEAKGETSLAADEEDEEGEEEFSEEQMLLRLLRMPAFLVFLRFLARVLGLDQTPATGEQTGKGQRFRIASKAEDVPEVLPGQRLFPGEQGNRVFATANGGPVLRGPTEREKIGVRTRVG